MRIAFASDHAGFELKQALAAGVRAAGHDVLDLGTGSIEPVDYPDFARALAASVLARRAERGVLICGSGVGASVAVNKFPGIRAGLCHDGYSAHQGVEHDDMNVLVLGARIIGSALAFELAHTFIGATFQAKEGRFMRRFEKVLAIEAKYLGGGSK